MSQAPPPLTLLYVPADRSDRVAKALASNADVVLVDLEDAVAPARKDEARANVLRMLADAPTDRPVQVRINHPSTPWHDDDVAALADLPLDVGARVPKVEAAEEVRRLATALPDRALHLLIESALGVEHALDIATAAPQVASIGLGEADLRSDLRVVDEAGLSWARSRVVVAARAARLPPPVMSAYPNVRDLDGLAESCRTGRTLGFRGRTAIHPAQLNAIRTAFLPTAEEVQRAREVIALLDGATAAGVGALALPDGTFLDVAMLEQARTILALAT
ncbi:citrate lyase subunit beta / citryl-CoA lyase [Saccharopolyspora antimicrobica]|uniref:Citrate lyase subunit beta / citryl-CoA lyase n=1 Tax=Saccharopolyspora antimicrobica TaxID=455193 RepID=A0A1I4VNY8_9PSEU|nr:CoA ester lyase [Saccharopolyspora antimicrobica]RKT87291.1 citrate lyase subunit beta/citryl-CoA lyase [Saccharopolyspora antimicrobica]SFN02819.1 citrate lyase subunit beta / citryl-CoA lyase [Saccharopolyspora antimicrobica]